MPPSGPVRRPGIKGYGQVEISEDLFRLYEKRVHDDACAAAEACAEAHQYAARDQEFPGKAALAASCVGTLAQRTAATAREVAQLCMGILEEAVQTSASPLARETAKRCAEQALRSVETASVAEQYSRSLCELLAPVMLGHEYPSTAMAQPVGGVGGVMCTNPPGATQPMMEVPAESPAQWPAPLQDDKPSMSLSSVRRWWDEEGSDGEPSLVLEKRDVPEPAGEDVARGAGDLETLLVQRVKRCKGLANTSGDERALKAIIEWRYGVSLARACSEEDLLSDLHVARLASWRSPPDEALPADLAEAARQTGAEQFSLLGRALRGATRQPAPEKAPATRERETTSEGFPGPFMHVLSGDSTGANDWEALFDRLGWLQNSTPAAPQSGTNPAGSTIALWTALSAEPPNGLAQSANSDADVDPTDSGWSIEQMTLRQLHLMSMHSRSKQRRGGVVKHKGSIEDGVGGTAISSMKLEHFDGPSEAPDGDDVDVQEFLCEVYGDLECPKELPEPSNSATVCLGAQTGVATPAPGARTTAGRKKKGKARVSASVTVPANVVVGGGTGVTLSTPAPVNTHALPELGQVLGRCLGGGPREDLRNEESGYVEPKGDALHGRPQWNENMQAGLQRPHVPLSTQYPGQLLQGLQQNMAQSLPQGLQQGLQQGLPQGLSQPLPQMHQVVHQGMPQGMPQQMPQQMAQLQQSLAQGLPQSLAQMPQAMQSLPQSLPQSFHGDLDLTAVRGQTFDSVDQLAAWGLHDAYGPPPGMLCNPWGALATTPAEPRHDPRMQYDQSGLWTQYQQPRW
uniref:Uncharacterized protein n=1 Tax=Noctiluca scintillans TaxID=2966 RepID=A0A7S1AKY8_NOCSC